MSLGGKIIFMTALLLVAGGWWWSNSIALEIAWQPSWPKHLEVEARAVEKIDPGALGHGERLMAAERARHKAWYQAQLKVGEQLKGLELAAETTLGDFLIENQSLKAKFEGVVHAAQEVPDRTRVVYYDNAVEAISVVRVPREKIDGLEDWVRYILESGTVSLSRSAGEAPRALSPSDTGIGTEVVDPKAGNEEAFSDEQTEVVDAEPTVADRSMTPEKDAPGNPPTRRPATPFSGAALYLEGPGKYPGLNASFFGGEGNPLGDMLDLPSELQAAGLPLAQPSEKGRIERYVGDRPRKLSALISKGDVYLEETLKYPDSESFKTWLREGRVILVVEPPGKLTR